VDDINAALEASARKHNLTLTAAAKFRIKSVPSAGEPVRRVTSEAILLAVPVVAGPEGGVPSNDVT